MEESVQVVPHRTRGCKNALMHVARLGEAYACLVSSLTSSKSPFPKARLRDICSAHGGRRVPAHCYDQTGKLA